MDISAKTSEVFDAWIEKKRMVSRFCLLALCLEVASGFNVGAPALRPASAAVSSSIIMKGAPVEEKKGTQQTRHVMCASARC